MWRAASALCCLTPQQKSPGSGELSLNWQEEEEVVREMEACAGEGQKVEGEVDLCSSHSGKKVVVGKVGAF